ncbi:MAG: clan AA aspartic protease [Pseudomonadales bacterium]|nr:clan AA aspartic protease [Pseudomonadales bacterium]
MKVLLVLFLGVAAGLGVGYYRWGQDVAVLPDSQEPADIVRDTPLPVSRELSEFEGLVVVAENLIQREDYAAAMEVLMEADIVAGTAAEQQAGAHLLREAVNARVAELRRLGLLDEIDHLYESLTFSMPERAEYYILLAEHRIEMQNGELALPVLAQVENHHQLGAQARELICQINAPDEASPLANIPLIRVGDQFLVEAVIDNEATTRLLLDTGASMTVITPGVLLDLGYSLDGPRAAFNTAGGLVRAPVVEISSMALEGVAVYPMTVGALELEGRVAGLLGMDFLRRFEFKIDQDQDFLVLVDRRSQ